jgi:hypothetical protein
MCWLDMHKKILGRPVTRIVGVISVNTPSEGSYRSALQQLSYTQVFGCFCSTVMVVAPMREKRISKSNHHEGPNTIGPTPMQFMHVFVPLQFVV